MRYVGIRYILGTGLAATGVRFRSATFTATIGTSDMKPKIEVGWKVVRDGAPFMSAIIRRGSVKYSVRYWTRPKKRCGPLAVFAFTAKESARGFIIEQERFDRPLRLVLCEYIPSARQTLYRPITAFDKNHYSHHNLTKKSSTKRLVNCPKGTRFARAVRLIDE